MKNSLLYFLIVLVFFAQSCVESPPAKSPPTWSQEDSIRLLETGGKITSVAFQTLSERLKSALENGGVEYAIPFCNSTAIPLTDSLASTHQAQIRRIAIQYRNPHNEPNATQHAIFTKMEHAIKTGKAAKPHIQQLADGSAAYYSPIILGEPCLKCHGEPNTDILKADMKLISELYPQDLATGFKIGDMRGMWEVIMPMKEAAKP